MSKTSKVKYVCCACDEDVTIQVTSLCGLRVDMPAIVFSGLKLLASHTVIVTCSKGHTCTYPCVGTEDKQ
jgi:hypothetical protein